LIIYAGERGAALTKMQASLGETAFLGLTTNIDFLQDLLAHPRVQSGDYDTRFVESNINERTSDGELPIEVLLAAALVDMQPAIVPLDNEAPDPYSPWESSKGFRVGEKP
jgi:acetyl/propionyl-CoA carboxylase alpha subunit